MKAQLSVCTLVAATVFAWCEEAAARIIPNDYDGDGFSDLVVWRPGDGMWYVIPSSGADLRAISPSTGWEYLGGNTYRKQWGLPGDVPVQGAFSGRQIAGNKLAEFAVYRPSNSSWYVAYSTSDPPAYVQNFPILGAGVIASADYDGDGKTDLAYVSDDCYHIRPSNSLLPWSTGSSNGQKIPGYWDGSSYGANPAIYVTASYAYWRKWSFATDRWVEIARRNDPQSGDIAVVGRYSSSTTDSQVRFRVDAEGYAHWILNDNTILEHWGLAGDVPIAGDFDRDGIFDPCVWRVGWPWAGQATFFVKPSSGVNLAAGPNPVGWQSIGEGFYRLWGFSTDIPLGAYPLEWHYNDPFN